MLHSLLHERFATLLVSHGAALAVLLASSVAVAQPDDDGEEEEANADGGTRGGGDGDGDGDGDDDKDREGGEPGEGKKPDNSKPAPDPETAPRDVDALRRRYLELRDKLFRSRARAATVASAIYSTSLQIKLDYKSARHYTVTRAVIRLDGSNVFDDAKGKISEDSAVRFEGYVAPGRHRLTVRIEATGKDDDRFVTATETTFVVVAIANKDLVIKAKAEDDGDIAYKWQRKEKGNYRLRLDVDVESVKRKGATKSAKSAKKKKKGKKAARATSGGKRATR